MFGWPSSTKEKKIRKQSVAEARRLGIAVARHLPVLDPDLRMRGVDEIATRIWCVYVGACVACGCSRSLARDWIRAEGLESHLTPAERRFLFDEIGDPEDFEKRIDALWALMWVVGLVPQLRFEEPCDDDFIHRFPDLKVDERSKAYMARMRLRPLHEVIAKLDLAYCLHHAAVTAAVSGSKKRLNLNYGIIARRHALEWVLGEDDWDEVSLDT